PNAYCYHYMDDILLAAHVKELLAEAEHQMISDLQKYGLLIAPGKIQRWAPWKYLGTKIMDQTIVPQTIEVKADIHTLNDVHK
ncbi:POK8 protein, partial [Herpetotheres cachinnans]|nr:POK8 protein [Herpetotheres cachinnans]